MIWPRGPVPIGAHPRPGLEAASALPGPREPVCGDLGSLPMSPWLLGRLCLSLLAMLQPFGGGGGQAWPPLRGPPPLGLETSLAPSVHWALGQPSCSGSPCLACPPPAGFCRPSPSLPGCAAQVLSPTGGGSRAYFHFPAV